MLDNTQAVQAESPVAPSSDDGGAASISVKAHTRPSRGKRSDREAGKVDKEARKGPSRTEREALPTADLAKRLKAENGEAEEAETVDASGTEEAPEALDASGQGEAPAAEAPDELASTKERLSQAEAHIAEVHASAKQVVRDYQLAQRKVAFYEKALEEALAAAGMELDPRAVKLMELESERELGIEGERASETARKAQEAQQVDAEVKRINSEISGAAKRSGIDAKSLTRRYIAAHGEWSDAGGKGPEPTVDDVVEEFKAVSAARQAKASSAAPTLSKPSTTITAARPRFDNNHAGWRAALKANGVG